MKKNSIFLVLALLAFLYLPCCVSCTDNNPEENQEEQNENKEPETKPEKPQAGNYTLVFPDQKGVTKTGWAAGDDIYFHGNYGPNAKVITLKAEDISDGGKKATVYLDETIMELQCAPDGIYAVYPASKVKQGDSLMDSYAEFTDWDGVLMMAYLSKDSFTFRTVTAALAFTVSGDYDSYVICGPDRKGLRITGYNADITSEKDQIATFKTDGYPFREGQLAANGTTVNHIFFPGGITFKQGCTLFVGKNGNYNKVYTVESALTLNPGDLVDWGNITSSLQDYTGPAPRMPEMGKSTKYTVKFNELSGICLSADGSFLWGVGDDGDIAKISFTGELLEAKRYIGGDAEAISMDPVTKDLLIGLEDGYQGLGRIAAPEYTGSMTKVFKIAAAKNFGNAGVEGLTYYKDGYVYLGTQQNSELFLCNLETGEVVMDKQLYNRDRVSEIADLCYDPLTDWLWIIDSEAKKIFVFTGDMETYLGAYPVGNISNPESVCVDHAQNCVWVGDDYGSTSYLYKFEFTGLDDYIKE